jgi:hypothetical protein
LRCSGGSVRADEETAGGLEEPGQQPQRRGLAAAGGAEQADQLAVVDRQRDIIDHRKRSKSLGQAAQINGRQSNSSRIVAHSHGNTRAPLSAALFIAGSI